jgi:hypothetical protein
VTLFGRVDELTYTSAWASANLHLAANRAPPTSHCLGGDNEKVHARRSPAFLTCQVFVYLHAGAISLVRVIGRLWCGCELAAEEVLVKRAPFRENMRTSITTGLFVLSDTADRRRQQAPAPARRGCGLDQSTSSAVIMSFSARRCLSISAMR